MLQKFLFLSATFSAVVSFASIVPGHDKTGSQDPLIVYQWGLINQNQSVLREADDIHSEKVEANSASPSDLAYDRARIEKLLQKDVVVAVLDSGLDVAHPDIQNKIFRNLTECDKGALPFPAKDDRDANGFVADCMGWDFTADGKGSNNVSDDLGHGTHVAGIIAAENDNNVGIAGFSSRIKILPLKVTSSSDGAIKSTATAAITERVQKALKYAQAQGADIVNISLGWPANLDSADIRKSFKDAQTAGMTIVAAAGNNNQAGAVFPCAYEGVICVGATTIERTIAEFSNFGGFVDVLAPGEEILSLIPTTMTPMSFSVTGYDIKGGTSQAAPQVAAIAALLKSANPKITLNEIKARLFSTALSLKTSRKFSAAGLVQALPALEARPTEVVVPVFKNLQKVHFQISSLEKIRFKLPVQNLWLAVSDLTVEVRSLSPQFKLSKNTFQVGKISGNGIKEIELSGAIQDLNADRQIQIEVALKSKTKSFGSFKHQFVLSRDLSKDAQVQKTSLRLSENRTQLPLLTVGNYLSATEHPFYYVSERAEKSLVLKFYSYKNGRYEESAPVQLNGISQLLSVLRIGETTWMTGVLTLPDSSKILQTVLLNEHFEKIEALDHRPEGAILGADVVRKASFVQFAVEGRQILAPVFATLGTRTGTDKNPDPFEFETNTPARHIYFHEPFQNNGKVEVRTRLYDNYQFEQSLKKNLSLATHARVKVMEVIPQTIAAFAENKIQILIGFGESSPLTYALVSATAEQLANHTYTLEKKIQFDEDLQNNAMDPLITFEGSKLQERGGVTFTGFYTQTTARSLLLKDNFASKEALKVASARRQDALLGIIQTFRGADESFAFYQTKSNLVLVRNQDGKLSRDEASIQRSSLLPGSVFNESFFPLMRQTSARSLTPAIYVDATQLLPQQIYTWVADADRGLTAPINLSVTVPDGCRALAPQRWESLNTYAYQFLCKSADQWEIRSLPVRSE